MPEVYYDVTVRANPKSMEELINKVHEAEDAIGDLKKAGGYISGFGGGGGGKTEKEDLGGTGMGYGFTAQMRAFFKKNLSQALGYKGAKEQFAASSGAGGSALGILKSGLKLGAIAGIIGLVVGAIEKLANVIKSIVQQSDVFQSIVNLTLAPFILMVNLMLVPALTMLIPYIIEMFTWVTENKDGLALFGTGIGSLMTGLIDAITNSDLVTFIKNFIELLTSVSEFSSSRNLSFGEGLWAAFANALQIEFSIAKMNPLVATLFGPWGIEILDAISAALEDTVSFGEFWINIQNMWHTFWTDLGNAFINAYNSTIGGLLGKVDNLSYTPISESSDSGFSKSGDTYIFDGIVFNQGDTQYTSMGEALYAHVKSLGGMS